MSVRARKLAVSYVMDDLVKSGAEILPEHVKR
jgi:hypothetical protein